MKELQNFIYKHMDALRHHKRYLAMLTALSMLVTFIVPLILIEPADSMTGILVCKKVVHTHNAECYDGNTLICSIEEHIHTGDCYKKVSLLSLKGSSSSGTSHDDNKPVPNAGGGLNPDGSYTSADAHPVVGGSEGEYYNPAELPLYTLLFGEGTDHWVDSSKSLEENLEIVDDEYFLGFASDFCAFIESDFTATDADAEGRVFIGGDLIFTNAWNYQVGAGDYGQFTPIWQTDEYGYLRGFASGIIGGKVYRLGTMTTGAYGSLSHDTSEIPDRHTDKNDVFLYPEEGAYKRFIVGNLKDSLHYDEDYKTRGDKETIDLSYALSCNHLYYDKGCTVCETNPSRHSYLGDVNELSQFYLYDDVSTILEKTFDTIRARSLSLASVKAIEGIIEDDGTLKLDASAIGDAKTVYFNISNWEGIKRVVITVPDDRITYTSSGDKEEKYSNGKKTIKNLDLNIIVSCGEEKIEITQNIPTFILAKDANEKPDEDGGVYYGYKISNRGKDDGANATNNHPVSSNILYNFYNATKVEFTGDTNFNGTIFAPNANVIAPEACRGHLSGALIAKSFYGGLEFGYRPYRGGVDIFGMASGYAIPVDKFDENNEFLPGALFAIKENAKFVSLFESGNGTNFAALPSRVDFTGQTVYEQDTVSQGESDRTYAGNIVIGEKLVAPLELTLYKDSGCGDNDKIENNTKLDNVYTKLYLKANQELVIDSNENISVGEPTNWVYPITLIKPVNSIEFTVKSAADDTKQQNFTVNFTPMALNVKSQNEEFAVNTGIELNAVNLPTNDTIYYKYFVNGNFIDVNNDTQDNDYIDNAICYYTPNAAGDYIFSVKAYVKNGENNYYEVAQATADKVTIKEADFPTEMSIELSGETFSNGTITSGNNIIVNLKTNDPNFNGTVEYSFNNGNYQTENEFDTQGIVGKDLPVKVRVSLPNKTPVELYDTITVNFKDNDNIALNISGCYYDEYGKLVYTVTSDDNDKISFGLQNIDQYQKSNPTVTYYFNNTPLNGNTVAKTVVGNEMPVYAIISANGLEKRIDGSSVTGKYNNELKFNVEASAFIVGDPINLAVNNAPNGAKVVFRAYDSSNNVVWTSDEQYVNNGGCSASFTPDKSGSYTFKAYMTFAENPVVELQGSTVTVNAKPVSGELSINPNQANAGTNIELKVYAATIGANVVYTIRDQYGNVVKTFNGTVDSNGECKIQYTPDQAGSYSVHALITKDGAERQLQQSLTIRENTTTLTGEFNVTPSGNRATVNVFNATNSAVVNVYITYANGQTQHQSGNINNGAYEYSFPTETDGVYYVRVTLVQNGTTLDLGEQSFTVGNINTSVTGTISVSPDSTTPKNNVTVTLDTDASNGTNVEFGVYYYYETNHLYTLTSNVQNGITTATFAPEIKGDYIIIARINGAEIARCTVRVNAVFTFDKSEYYAGDEVTITVSEVNEETISEVLAFNIGGIDVGYYTVNQNTISFKTSTEFYGNEYALYLKIRLSGGAETELSTKIKNLARVQETQTLLALRRNLSILADENIAPYSDDNLIVIEAPENERIDSVRIVFPSDIDASQAKFTIKATLNDVENNTITYTNNDVQNNEIVISGSNITKIEITPTAGSITIDKCYPTYVRKENKITQTYAQDFTLGQYEEKEIVLDNWLKSEDLVQTLDSITFNLDESNTANEGDIYYALIHEGETTASEFIKAEPSNNKIEITGINAENIEKIKIYTTKSSLTFKDYTISAFVGGSEYTSDELEDLETKTQDITSVYTLVEQQAPIGYFKEDTVYIVEVKETIRLDELVSPNQATYPSVVYTTVTVKDTAGNEVLSYKLRISYPKTDDGINANERTVEFLGENDVVTDTFDLTRGTDSNGNDTLTVKNSSGETLNWDTTKPAQYDNYYFDPNAMMVVPVSEIPIEYINEMGLLFRKIDDKGASVKGVEIKLYEGDTEVTDSEMWYWDENSSEWLIDYKKLSMESVYRFTETDAGGKYELAKDIYFKRTADKEITYWTDSETMPEDTSKLTVLNLNNERIIRMENTRITGIKIKLRKTDMNGGPIGGTLESNNFAIFSLHANDGTELLDNIEVINGEVELDFSGFDVNDTTYVENGYLKPGTYYLKETQAPSGYEASTKYFYFNVVKSTDGAFGVTSSEILPGITLTEETQSNGDVHRVTRFKADALEQISDGLTAETINASTPIIQFKFKTDGGQMGWGNAKFSAVINGEIKTPNNTKFPSGCNYHAESGGMSFQNTDVTVEFTVQQLCELFDISVSDFNTINEFVISTWNKTDVEELDFWVIENPINSGNNGSSDGNAGNNDSSGQSIREVMFCANPDGTNYKVKKMTFYLSNGETSSIENPSINKVSNYNHLISLPEKTQNVIAVVIEVEGNGSDKLKVVNTAGEKIWGDLKDQYDSDALYTEINGNGTYIIPKTFDPNKPVETTSTAATSSTSTTTTTVTAESTTTTTTKAIPMLSINKNVVIIPNEALGVEMNLRVDKKWVGDEDATEFRKPVNVVLKRKTGENGTYVTFKPEGQAQDYITLDSSNNWSYIWKDLPRYENGPTDEGEDVLYYYKVDEVTSVTGYTSSVPDVNINEGGTIVITNTAETVDIPVEKYWNSNGNGDVSAILPETLNVKLQAEIDGEWKDIPGKTLTLTVNNKQGDETEQTQTWAGTFENLPEGYKYKVVEVDVPFGWKVKYDRQEITAEETNAETINGFKLSNSYEIATGSIAVQKLWQDLTGEAVLPYSITVDLYRSVIAPSYTDTDAPWTDDNANKSDEEKEDYKTDYARLLQHSLYFYDANMCGTDVAANSAMAWRTNCHTEDEVVGGYHDAGDHAVFGLPQGYAASMLGWTYYEFIKDNTSDAGGKVNSEDARHFKVILERFYDFFVDSVKYSDGKISEILVQKGDGNVDHSYWGAPEKQAERKTTGEDNEMFWSSYGADIASEYAAALAIGYLNFYDSNGSDEHKEKYENYLEVAKDLFEFAKKDSRSFNEWGINLDETLKGKEHPGFYESQSYLDDMALAAGWLHLADQNGGYKAEFEKIKKDDGFWGFSWNDVTLAAYAVGAHIGSNNWSDVASAIDKKIDKNSPDNYFKQDNWGSARYNAIMQTAALVAAKHGQNTDTYKKWAVGQMNLLLGGNSWKNTLNGVCDGGTISDTTSPICLVTNFVPDGFTTDTPEAPHHRAASGWESLEEYKVNCGYDDDSYALIGALVGGPAFGNHDDGKQLQMHAYNHDHPLANHTYIDCLHDYCCNEVSLDYNAGLVGAAAGLYYFYGTGKRSEKIEGVEYGAYGLIPPTATDNGIESPTQSAVPEAAQQRNYSISDEEVNMAVLTAFSMRQTAVSILGDENTIVFNSTTNADYFNNIIGNGADVESLLFGKNITKIEVSLTQQDACFKLNGQRFLNNSNIPGVGASWNGNTLILIPQEENGVKKFKALWDSDVQNDSITSIKCEQWGGSLNSITVYYEILGFSITNSETKLVEGDMITLKTSGKADNSTVNWTSPNGTGTGDTYDFTAGHVTQDTNIEITATDGTNTAKKTLTINPLAFTENSITIEGFNAEQTLELNSIRPLTNFNWSSSDSTYITVENGIITAKKTTTNPITITATDKNNPEISASIQVSANVPVEALTISGESTTGIGGEITLTKSGGPLEALSYKWTSSDTSIATVDQNGKVTGVAAGDVTIKLEAYSNADMTGTVLESVEKTITIKNVRTLTVHNQGTESDGGNKYFYSLSNLPAGAILKKVTIHVTPTNGQDTAYEGALMLGKEETPPEPWEQMNISGTFSGSGDTITIDNTKDSNNGDKINMDIIDCSKHDFCFGLWSKSCTVNIDWITFEYEMDSTYIDIKYNDDSDEKTIRNGQSVSVTVTATGGGIGSVQLMNGETVVQDLGNGGSYTITPENAGNYTIVAAMAGDNSNKTDSIALTVKDDITINGSTLMDLNASQTLTVNNAIGTITWGAAEGTEHTVDGDIITFKNGATLNTRTGKVTAGSNGGEFTITATDSHDGNTSRITISITERPKLPELPKDIFLERVPGANGKITLTEENNWTVDVSNLPMTDAKGNPYYYYIQESGYTQSQGGTEKPLTDSVGHYIYSNNAVYMPISYYNNGIIPVESGNPAVAKVGNKFVSETQGQLPSTGGSGVKTYYYFGGALMLLGIAGFTGLKRRERKRREE